MSRGPASIRSLTALATARNANDFGGVTARLGQLQLSANLGGQEAASKTLPAGSFPLTNSHGSSLGSPSWQLRTPPLPGTWGLDGYVAELTPCQLPHLMPAASDLCFNMFASQGSSYKPSSQGQDEHKKDTRKHGPSGGPSAEGDEVTDGVGAGQMPRQDVPPVMPGSPQDAPPSPDVTQPGENVIKPEYTTPGTDRGGPRKGADTLRHEAHSSSYLRQVTEEEVLKREDHTAARRAENALENGNTASGHFDDVPIEGVVHDPHKRKVWAATAPIESLLELRNPLKPGQPQQRRGYATFATQAGKAGGRTPKQGPGVQDEGPGTINDPNTNPPTIEQQRGTPTNETGKGSSGDKPQKPSGESVENVAKPKTDADFSAQANANGNDYDSDARGRAPSKHGDSFPATDSNFPPSSRIDKEAAEGEMYANPTGHPVDIAPEQSGG